MITSKTTGTSLLSLTITLTLALILCSILPAQTITSNFDLLQLNGETIISREGTPVTGHPGTPLGVRRTSMPPRSLVSPVINLAVTCHTPTLPYFGPALGFQATDSTGIEHGMGQISAVWLPNGSTGYFFVGRTPQGTYEVFASITQNGLTIYTGPGYFPNLPTPYATLP